jgi:DNA-binding NtrC family response regulator
MGKKAMRAPNISILSFADKGEDLAIQGLVAQLGYGVRVIPATHWLLGEAKSSTDISIIILACSDLPKSRIVARLAEETHTSWFGFFHGGGVDWDSSILEQCAEFSRWPCEEQELRVRLEKLFQHQAQGTADDWDECDQDFVRLNIVGRSPNFLQTLSFAKKIGQCDAPVVIQGETGTGKEIFARALHYLGKRREYPFVPVNCGAIPDSLLENELFGHERGAFTDAHDRQPGWVQQADRGTLFLDEVDTLSPKAQVALLRFLQDQIFHPLGSQAPSRVNVRIIAASNQNLQAQVRQHHFRQDLFYRLNVLSLMLPPLRQRRSDISLLSDHILRQLCARYAVGIKTLHPRVVRWMNQYGWPGNVRELENFLHRSVVVSEGPVLNFVLDDLDGGGEGVEDPDPVTQGLDLQLSQAKAHVVEDFEKGYLLQLMQEEHGNVSQAAKRAGKDRRAFGRLLKKHNICRGDFLLQG